MRAACTTEHAGEAATIEAKGGEDLTAFCDSHAVLMRHVRIPGGAAGVEADTVGRVVAEVGPDPTTGEIAVGANVERHQVMPVRIGDHEGAIVRGDGHSIGEGEVLRHHPHHAVRGDQGHEARLHHALRRTGGEVEVPGIDVGVTASVDDDVIPTVPRRLRQVRIRREAAIRLQREQRPPLVRNQHEPAAGQEVEAQRQRSMPDHHLAAAVVVDRDDLARRPVTEPEPALVPARRLHEPQAAQQDVHLDDLLSGHCISAAGPVRRDGG